MCLRNKGKTKGGVLVKGGVLKHPPPPSPPPSNFIGGRQCGSAVLVLSSVWFFGDFRCSVSLFIVILVKYKQVKIDVKC